MSVESSSMRCWRLQAGGAISGRVRNGVRSRCIGLFVQRVLTWALTALGAVLVAACAANTPPPMSPVRAGLGCVDDSLECRNRRQAALAALLADRSRSWVRQPADAAAYASGVRLFAFKQRKRELDCAELGIGKREANAARPTLRAAANQLTPAQIARGAMLGDEVGQELTREHRRRGCKV